MVTCADRLRAFIKRVLDLTFLLKNSTATVADQKTYLNCAKSVHSKSVALSEVQMLALNARNTLAKIFRTTKKSM